MLACLLLRIIRFHYRPQTRFGARQCFYICVSFCLRGNWLPSMHHRSNGQGDGQTPPPGLPTEGGLGRSPRSAYRGGWADPSMGYYGLQSASIVLDLNQFVHQKRRLDGVFQHHSPKSKYSLCWYGWCLKTWCINWFRFFYTRWLGLEPGSKCLCPKFLCPTTCEWKKSSNKFFRISVTV